MKINILIMLYAAVAAGLVAYNLETSVSPTVSAVERLAEDWPNG